MYEIVDFRDEMTLLLSSFYKIARQGQFRTAKGLLHTYVRTIVARLNFTADICTTNNT